MSQKRQIRSGSDKPDRHLRLEFLNRIRAEKVREDELKVAEDEGGCQQSIILNQAQETEALV
jgi:hypothetical protein